MDREGRTINVCGLPTDTEEDKLKDKLYIHFLRQRNGGGEISSVSISRARPGCALIAFEDREVAQRVVQYGRHTLLVDDKKYELNVSLLKKNVDKDEVFVHLKLTVNFRQLPLGKETLTGLQQSFPNVQFKFHPEGGLCTLSGSYSEVQSLVTHLLGLLETQAHGTTCVPERNEQVSTPVPIKEKNLGSKGKDHHRSKEQTALAGKSIDLDFGSSGIAKSERNRYSGFAWEDYGGWQAEAVARRDEPPLEDYSLVLDSDIFHYLQQHCDEEYKQILNQHRVEVVDVTMQDVTTLYLRALDGMQGASGQHLACVQQVHWKLGQLYQKNEARLRKEQLPKRQLSKNDLQAVYETLQLQMPKLMMSDDESYIYLVGSSSDVSEAKCHLLYLQGEHSKQRRASYSESRVPEDRDTPTFASTSSGKMQDSSEDKLHRAPRAMAGEAGRQSMLEAKFKEVRNEDPGVDRQSWLDDMSGDTWKDFSFSNLKQMTNIGQRLDSGPVQDRDGIEKLPALQRLSEPSQSSLSLRANSLSATSSEISPLRTLLSTGALLPNKTKYFMGAQPALQSDLFQERRFISNTAPSPKLGGQSMQRSFSGSVRSKQDEDRDISRDNHGEIKTGTNHVSDNTEKEGIYCVEVYVPGATWLYIKDIYHSWLENIKSTVHFVEVTLEEHVAITLSGTDPEKLSNCQTMVKKQVAAVSADFTTQELYLTKEQQNKTLEVCCTELRRKFPQVKIVQKPKKIYLLGPKRCCDQVSSRLIEAFGNGIKRKTSKVEELLKEDANNSSCLPSQNQHIPLQEFLKDQKILSRSDSLINQELFQCNSTMGSEKSQKDRGGMPSSAGEHDIQRCDSVNTEHEVDQFVVKSNSVLKPKLAGITNKTYLRSDKAQSQPTETNQASVLLSGSVSLPSFANTQKVVWPKARNEQAHNLNQRIGVDTGDPTTPLGGNSRQTNSKSCEKTQEESQTQECVRKTCVCGMNEGPVLRMDCGVTFCSKCLLENHFSCKVCQKVKEVRGIRGKIYFTEMSLSLPGHQKDTTLKITYDIPDGIQGEDHPNPGAPFRGGTFKAYLPLNEQVRKLLPLLEKAFAQGLTFTVSEGGGVGQVTWGSIPHKTSIEHGISKKGYPDSGYVRRLSDALKSLATEDGTENRTRQKNKN